MTASSADFEALVKTNAPAGPLTRSRKPPYKTSWSFSPGGSSGTTAATTGEETVDGEATGLEPNTEYTVTFTAGNAGGSEEVSTSFTTDALAPTIDRATLLEPTQTSIILAGTVNPHNAPLTDCHFAYGEDAALDQTVPCATNPTGNQAATVTAPISGLKPGTEYSFRLVATNLAGTSEGDPRSFHTFPVPSADACPNEAIRVQQHSTALPGCRAWEMVSPAEKNGGEVFAEGINIVASASGNGVSYSSKSAFADSVGTGNVGLDSYLGTRVPSGWLTHSITPTAAPTPTRSSTATPGWRSTPKTSPTSSSTPTTCPAPATTPRSAKTSISRTPPPGPSAPSTPSSAQRMKAPFHTFPKTLRELGILGRLRRSPARSLRHRSPAAPPGHGARLP